MPLFVAVDALGMLPIFIGLTSKLPASRKPAILIQSLITASIAAILFLFGGPAVLRLINITLFDFMVAGGILLLSISLTDILTGEKRRKIVNVDTIGAVPIGVPLITGPAVFTTSVLLANSYGIGITAIAVLINIFIAVVTFWFSDPIVAFLGNAGTRTFSKIASMFLAAIAVMLIRKGIEGIITEIIGNVG